MFHPHTIYRLTKALTHYSLISEVHLSVLRSLSAQASVITDVVCAMGFLLSVYQTTFSNVQTVFLTFVEQAGRYVNFCVDDCAGLELYLSFL